MTKDAAPLPFAPVLNQADLTRADAIKIDIAPTAAQNAAIAKQLGLSGLRKVRMQGTLSPLGKQDWRMSADLGATIVQPCVVTLDLVTTRIDEPIERIWRAKIAPLDATDEVEMPEDTSEEPLGHEIDLGTVLVEALALALPLYPRSKNAELAQNTFAAPDITPMSDEDARPFSGLAGLRDSLKDPADDVPED